MDNRGRDEGYFPLSTRYIWENPVPDVTPRTTPGKDHFFTSTGGSRKTEGKSYKGDEGREDYVLGRRLKTLRGLRSRVRWERQIVRKGCERPVGDPEDTSVESTGGFVSWRVVGTDEGRKRVPHLRLDLNNIDR